MRFAALILALLPTLLFGNWIEDAIPLTRAHAHNDYQHPRPLFDVLDQGFCSVEADIFLMPDGQLLVGHEKKDLKPERTLEKLYLAPLRERANKSQGKIFASDPTFYLLIDVKSEAKPTYSALHRLLANYADILTEVNEGKVIERAVTVVVSGNRPSLSEMAEQAPRFAGYDGRLTDLNSDVPSHLMPWISDRWVSNFNWNGDGPIPDKERQKLQRIVAAVHQHQRKVRFWATAEKPIVWQLLFDEKVS